MHKINKPDLRVKRRKLIIFATYMKKDTKILLTITPIDDKTARLVKVVGVTNENTVFTNMGCYEGYNNYGTAEALRIVVGEFEGKEYTITAINGCSFSHCRELKEIFIGAQVCHIDWNMYQCVSLLNIMVDPKNKVFHDIDGVLFEGKELKAFPQGRRGKYVVPEGTKKLGNHSFKSSHIEEIVLPSSLEEIGINVFYECRSLSEIVLPPKLKKVSMNCNRNNKPISQKFFLADDSGHTCPLTISDVIKRFPE